MTQQEEHFKQNSGYSPQSGELKMILKGMGDKMSKDLTAANLVATMKKEIDALTVSLERKQR